MKEQALQAKIIKHLNSNGFYVIKVIMANRSGVPDIISCYKGQFYAFEVKSEIGKMSELQKYNKKTIENAGGKFYMINDFNVFLRVFDTIVQ